MSPPSFGEVEYWERRYARDRSVFEWLSLPKELDNAIVVALQTSQVASPRLLHIGCGTSSLSLHLRKLVSRPEQIHNTDYSLAAIELGRMREREAFGEGHDGHMHWSVVDLLSATAIVEVRLLASAV